MNKKTSDGNGFKAPVLKPSTEFGRPSVHQKIIKGAVRDKFTDEGMIKIPKPLPREKQLRDNYKL